MCRLRAQPAGAQLRRPLITSQEPTPADTVRTFRDFRTLRIFRTLRLDAMKVWLTRRDEGLAEPMTGH
jgi:hypothetical protein